MKNILDHISFAISYIVALLFLAIVCSFVPILNIIVWVGTACTIFAYPLLHFSLYEDHQKREKERLEKEQIEKYKHQKALQEARAYFG